ETVKEWNVQENIAFTVDIDNQCFVEMDYIRLKQIFTNLFNNAKHAMANIENGEINIYTKTTDQQVHLYIADNGSGIPLTDQDYIFEKFFRGKSKQAKTNGFGLGLPYSRMLAQAMDGDLT